MYLVVCSVYLHVHVRDAQLHVHVHTCICIQLCVCKLVCYSMFRLWILWLEKCLMICHLMLLRRRTWWVLLLSALCVCPLHMISVLHSHLDGSQVISVGISLQRHCGALPHQTPVHQLTWMICSLLSMQLVPNRLVDHCTFTSTCI